MKFTRLKIFSFLLLFIWLLIPVGELNAQFTSQDDPAVSGIPNDTITTPIWAAMWHDQNANYYDVVRAFNLYWSENEVPRGSGYKQFKRWEYANSSRIDQEGFLQSPKKIKDEVKKFNQLYGSTSSSQQGLMADTWTELGPVGTPTNGTGQPNGQGRLNNIGFHPTDPNTIYVGAPAGGLWKTTNGGTSWTSSTDQLTTLGVSAIAVDKDNPNTVYIGTGDRDAADAPGKGIMKSLDGGVSFTSSNTGMGDVKVGELIQHPTNGMILIAATTGGIYRTTNGGANWTPSSGTTGNLIDVKFKPGDPNTVYGSSFRGRIYVSTDGGMSFTQAASSLPSPSYANRAFLGVSPAEPTWVYAMFTDYTKYKGLWRSTDSGVTWTLQSSTPNIFDYATDGSGSAGQGFYSFDFDVDPTNASRLTFGSVNIWASTNAGVNWTAKSFWAGNQGSLPGFHADVHQVRYNGSTIYFCTDAGIFSSTDGATSFVDKSANIAISQLYKLGQGKQTAGKIVGGFQDNGTAILNGGAWTTVIGGDGMECSYDPLDENYVYGETYTGSIRRSTNGGTNFSSIKNNINESAAWVMPFVVHHTNGNSIFAGFNNVWRTTNAKAPSSSSVSWSSIGPNADGKGVDIAQSEANTDILYYSTSNNKFYRTDNVNAASPIWTTLTLPSNSSVLDIMPHPSNENIVFIVSNKKVYRSADKGATWTDISSNLPDITAHSIIMEKGSNEVLYVGMDAGVYCKNASETSWTNYTHNLPLTQVREMEIWYDTGNPANNRLRAVTYGRGMWTIPLAVHNCSITAIATSNLSACNDNGTPSPGDDTFTASVTVTFSGAPGSGTLNLTGDGTASVDVGSLGSATSHTFTNVSMSADGTAINLIATFSANTGCTFTNANAGTAPVACSTGPCSINTISIASISACSLGFFTADVTATFFNKPASGTLDLTGDGTASVAVGSITGNSHTFTAVSMAADGTPISLTATFSATPTCTLTNANAGTAPAGCGCDIVITSVVPTNESCPGGTDGTITVNATSSNTIEYSIDGGATYQASNVFNGLPAATYSIKVRDMGNDACSATSSTMVMDVADTEQPVITCPEDLFGLNCMVLLPPVAETIEDFIMQGGTVSDNCSSNDELGIDYLEFDNGGSDCPNDPLIVTRVYFIFDASGNESECEQEFDYLEAQPTEVEGPEDATVECEADIMIDLDSADVFVDCFFGYDIELDGPVIAGTPDCPGTTYTYTFTVTDDCGISAEDQTVYTIQNTPPTITCPADMTVECLSSISLNPDDANVTTSCTLGSNTVISGPVQSGISDCPGTTYTYTYTVTDDCGRSASCEQVFTIENDGLTIVCPADMIVECFVDIAVDPTDATVTTSCTLGSNTVITGPVQVGPDDCPGTTYTYTYTTTDDCGRTASCDQVFTIQNLAPIITCPADQVVTCFEDIVADPTNLTVVTACGMDFFAYVKQPLITGGIPGCDGTVYTYIYKVTDACGRVSQCEQQFLIQNSAPTVTVPAGGTIDCFSDIVVSTSDATVVADCLGDNVINVLGPVIGGPVDCPGTTYTYTYRVKDACDRIVEVDRVFTIGNNSGPIITSIPLDFVSECETAPSLQQFLAVSSCGGAVETSVSGPVIQGTAGCSGTNILYTYTATDACGRIATHVQTITLQNEGPIFTSCEEDQWLQFNCEDYGGEAGTIAAIEAYIASVEASSSCGEDLTVFNNFNANNINTCINNGYNEITFRATDNCGRTSFCKTTYVVVDTEAPTIFEEAQDHWEICNFNTPANFNDWINSHGGADAYDPCSTDNIFWSTIPANPSFNCDGAMGITSTTVTFRVRDNCGNVSTTTATFNAFMSNGGVVIDPNNENVLGVDGSSETGLDLTSKDLNAISLADEFALYQNQPNPFSQETTISFYLPEAQEASLTIYDLNGKVLKIVQNDYSKGYNEIRIHGNDLSNTGMLFYELRIATKSLVGKMILTK